MNGASSLISVAIRSSAGSLLTSEEWLLIVFKRVDMLDLVFEINDRNKDERGYTRSPDLPLQLFDSINVILRVVPRGSQSF